MTIAKNYAIAIGKLESNSHPIKKFSFINQFFSFRVTVRRGGPNKGRSFVSCPVGVENGCGYFEWITDQVADERTVLSEVTLNISESQKTAPADASKFNEEPKSKVEPSTNSRRQDWSASELADLIQICAKSKFFQKTELQPSKNNQAYREIQHYMVQKSHSRNKKQLAKKIYELKKGYDILKSKSGNDLMAEFQKKKYYATLYEVAIKENVENVSDLPRLDASSGEILDQNQILDVQNHNPDYSDTNVWSDKEITDLLTICIDRGLYDFKDSKCVKTTEIKMVIHKSMKDLGCNKTYNKMCEKICNLSTDYTTNVLQRLGKSGEAGIAKLKEKRPYLDLMIQLFGKRPKNSTPNFDSLDLKSVLDESISNDHEAKTKYPKPAHSAVRNILANTMNESRKEEAMLFERAMKHDEMLNNRNIEFLGNVIKESCAGLGDILKGLIGNSNINAQPYHVAPTPTYLPQFSPYSANNATSSHYAPYNMPQFSTVGAAGNHTTTSTMPQFSPVGATGNHTTTANMPQFSPVDAARNHTTIANMPQFSPVSSAGNHATPAAASHQLSTASNNNGAAVSNTSSNMHELSQNCQNFPISTSKRKSSHKNSKKTKVKENRAKLVKMKKGNFSKMFFYSFISAKAFIARDAQQFH